MSRFLIALAAMLVPAASSAQPAMPAEATACVTELREARHALNQRKLGRLAGSIDGYGPVDRPPRPPTARREGRPGFERHGWSAHVDIQRRHIPEYYYVDVLDVRDDRGGWASLTTGDVWTCRELRSRDQHNLECVRVRDDRVAVVRVIHWHRRAPPRIAAFVDAFRAATERCLSR